MGSSSPSLMQLEQQFRASRRTVFNHVFFLLACCVAAVLIRRYLRFPPQLSWVVFAAAGIVFGGDVVRMFRCRMKLKQALRELTSA